MAGRVSQLATPSATAEVLSLFGLTPKKAFGQNFLINDDVVRKILELAQVGSADDILEVGPGIGTLTCALADRARSVVSIERDVDLVPVLAHTMATSAGFQVVVRDALAIDAADVAAAQDELRARDIPCAFPTKLVANLPYAVAATVVLAFFQRFDDLTSATVMVQREVAERMQARPGTKDYGAYTVKLSLFAHPQGSFRVPASSFLPRPRVESTVIRLDRAVPCDEWGKPCSRRLLQAACTMADAAFFARRKTIANSCKAYFSGREAQPKDGVFALLEAARIDPGVRGETLAAEDFIRLGQALVESGPAPGDIV